MAVKPVCLSALFLLLTVVNGAPAVRAQEEPLPRLITVTGDAEVQVVPDQVILTLGVETFEKELNVAKTQNDDRVKALLTVVQEQKIDSKDVQTDYITIRPNYSYMGNGERKELLGYMVQKTIVITLRDLSKFESLLSSALIAGANYVHGIEFKTSELHKYRDQARAMAIKAAQEKATALAGELGQKIGRPNSIQEGYGWAGSGYRGWWGGGSMPGAQSSAQVVSGGEFDTGMSGGGSFAPGQIKVKAQVTVSFELTG